MLSRFNRSITFRMSRRPKRSPRYHARSISLPGSRSHPFIANLEDMIRSAESWAAGADASLASIEAGMSCIELLLSAVNEFLNLTETKTGLQHTAASTESHVGTFLYLVDSYGSMLSDMITLKQHHFDVQSAVRRHDSALLTSSLKSQKRTEKELSHLAVTLRATTKCSESGLPSHASEAEIIAVLMEVISAASAATVVLLNRVLAVSAAASAAAASIRHFNFKTRSCDGEREMSIHVKFEELEECIGMVERGSERVLRSLLNSRVLLLNIQSGLF